MSTAKRLLAGGTILLALLGGGVAGAFSLDAQAWLYGPLHQSARYSGFGGAMRGLVEGLFAICAGAVVAARAAWLCCGAVSHWIWKERLPGGRVHRLDFAILGSLLLWCYLIWASW
jgi:hypothetical protein